MKTSTDLGLNRTGIGTSPLQSKELIQGAQSATPSATGTEQGLAEVRIAYAHEANPVGTLPPPPSLKGMAKTALQALKGQKPTVLLDKLGERAAFERTGTRLYEGLISKFDAYGTWEGGPTRADLARIHREELAHFGLVVQAIERLGADPTVMTPSADIAAVASMGLVQVISDPRTSLRESLEAILIAELTDNDCWENLVKLTRAAGQDEIADAFAKALAEERVHLVNVRAWVAAGVGREAHLKLEAEPAQPVQP